VGVDYDNGLIVGTLIGKEISPTSDRYIAGDIINPSYLKWDTAETVCRENPDTSLDCILIGVDPNGNLYMLEQSITGSDSPYDVLKKYNLDGNLLWSVSIEGGAQALPTQNYVDISGNIYVMKYNNVGLVIADGGNNSGYTTSIIKVSPDGNTNVLRSVGGKASALGVDNLFGYFYIGWRFADLVNYTTSYMVIKSDPDGVEVWQRETYYVSGLVVDNLQNIYAECTGQIIKFDKLGSTLLVIPEDGGGTLRVDILGNLYAGIVGSGGLKKFTPAGASVWGGGGTYFIAVDRNTYPMLVTCSGGANIINAKNGDVVWHKAGTYTGCAVDAQGNFYFGSNSAVIRLTASDHFLITGPRDANFVATLNTYDDNASKQILGCAQDTANDVTNNTNARVTGSLSVNGTWPHISFTIQLGLTYTNSDIQLYIKQEGKIYLQVLSIPRKNALDLVGLTLDVENNTIYPIEIIVINEDSVDPRFVLGAVTGSNTSVTVI